MRSLSIRVLAHFSYSPCVWLFIGLTCLDSCKQWQCSTLQDDGQGIDQVLWCWLLMRLEPVPNNLVVVCSSWWAIGGFDKSQHIFVRLRMQYTEKTPTQTWWNYDFSIWMSTHIYKHLYENIFIYHIAAKPILVLFYETCRLQTKYRRKGGECHRHRYRGLKWWLLCDSLWWNNLQVALLQQKINVADNKALIKPDTTVNRS